MEQLDIIDRLVLVLGELVAHYDRVLVRSRVKILLRAGIAVALAELDCLGLGLSLKGFDLGDIIHLFCRVCFSEHLDRVF